MMNCHILPAIVFLVTCLAGSSVLADDKAKAVHSQRLFFTPLERTRLVAETLGAEAAYDSISPDEQSPAGQMPNFGLKGSADRQKQSSELQAAHPRRIIFNALVSTAKGAYILLNGVPCYRFYQRSQGMPMQSSVRLSCPHIDKGRYQIDYVASVEKIDVYSDGKRLGLLSVGESL